ncbi:MAG: Na+/H+ antiporter NhaC family protein [Holophagae bacterium]
MSELDPQPEVLRFRGGVVGALAPFALFLVGVAWLGLSGAPDERGFWPILTAALALAMLLAVDRSRWADTVIDGMSRPIVLLMILAWLLAGVLASLINASGFVGALVAAAEAAGVHGGGFAAASFLVCCLVSTATGTSLGTMILCAPLLYPAAAGLGADPVVLMGAVIGGATFGDNISPVSDTTIASASTQGADIGGVVRSRLKYAVPAAVVALAAYSILGGGADVGSETSIASGNLRALAMALAPAVVIALLVAKRPLLEGLLTGILAAAGIGLALGLIRLDQLIFIDLEAFSARGLLIDGMERGIGISIFTILLAGLVAGVEASGVLARIVDGTTDRIRSARGAEAWMFSTTSAAVLLTTHSVVALLTVGEYAREIGARFGVGRYRRANVLDLTVCIYPFIVPYCIPTVLASSTTRSGLDAGLPHLGPLQIGLANFHSWALLLVTLVAIVTGYGRSGGGDGTPDT